ncbi:NHL repeat-containing protein [uncultured Winogradskyella sp.]|uniref:NHL repeat-containing protein n=1 Tax=uncultured Winogradskyella sp. TaxID=395353 RepID=UPI002634FF9B|nr:NHL repeat-containing protein [uncultured Winogradskyella sp.]
MKKRIFIYLSVLFISCGSDDSSDDGQDISPLSPVTSIIVSDVTNNGNASDISINFSDSSQNNLLAYRAFVLNVNDNLSLDEALDLPNSVYHEFLTGNTITLPPSLLAVGGSSISEGVEYKVAILSLHSLDIDFSVLSSFSEEFTLVNTDLLPLEPVTSIAIMDNTNNGNASDIDLSFQSNQSSELLAGYRIFVLKDNASIDLNEALSSPSEQYAQLSSSESQVILESTLKDTDGDDIVENQNYKIIVLSEHSNENSLSALSNPSPTFTLERTNLMSTLVPSINIGTGGVSVDENGVIYVADFGIALSTGNGSRVMAITPEGNVSTFISGFMDGASGNHIDAQGNFYQSHQSGGRISITDTNGVTSNFTSGGVLSAPIGIAIDSQNNLFVANCNGNNIIKIDSNGNQSVFATSNLFSCPNGITFDLDGNLYVANFSNGNVIKVDSNGLSSVFATVPGNNNGHIIFSDNKFYVVARSANQIYEIDLQSNLTLLAGNGTRGSVNGAALNANLSLPNDLDISPDGTKLYINEVANLGGTTLSPSRIRVIHLDAEN